ncbi:hypothetical protein [Aquimarina latercula]|uniref:hypothetical protein n=1 Tax=Aquimarina latercula TaxID=987 RepID=UPI00040CFEDC|nr:hypothetical protein [Aquimarina latercula]
MSRLSLDAFKAKAQTSQSEELENLTGGILGACHPGEKSWFTEIIEEILDDLNN